MDNTTTTTDNSSNLGAAPELNAETSNSTPPLSPLVKGTLLETEAASSKSLSSSLSSSSSGKPEQEQTPEQTPPPTLLQQSESSTITTSATEPSVFPSTSPPPQQPAASKVGSRFSVNLSAVGLPAMASNLGLTQANGERAADMAQDLKKNVVNMWNTWFTAPPASSSSSSSSSSIDGNNNDSAALKAPLSGTQSLSSHHQQQQRPAKTQRMNSYTLGSKSLGNNLSTFSSSPSSPRGYSLDIPDRKTTKSPSPDLRENDDLETKTTKTPQQPPPKDKSITIVHEANDPVATRSSTCVAPPSNVASTTPIYLMGKLYPPSSTQWTDFQRDFTLGLIWCTYRHGYAPIKPSTFTSDVGWGCMLRSGQGLLANALAIQFMGRDWNRPSPEDPMWDIYVRILSWFLDDMNAKSPFSVHRIALLGKQLGKNIGEWFGPSTTSQVTKALVHNFPESGLGVYVTTDGVIYKDQVEEAATLKKSGGFGNLLILVTIRLGIDKLNPIYNDAIKKTLEFPQTLGIAGGRPSSSYYFVGYQGDELFYLDPHHSRCVVETKDLNDYTVEDLATYHCETIRKIDINAIDPSMLLAFYCRDRADFDAFCDRVQEMNARPGMGSSIFTIGEKAPDYDDDMDGQLLSVADDEDDDLELVL
ncbi:Cysteine protease atg4 [Gryganskiella cystojenkinii]|nr:Cysteine protease atg4 [Gryganskiella cystojenkinii]